MSELRLDIARLAKPGRKPSAAAGWFSRELGPDDLSLLAEPSLEGTKSLTRITERHHALARALAAGLSESDAAFSCGYDLARVSVIKQSPAFQELLQLYRAEVDRKFVDTAARLSGLAQDAIVELQRKLEDAPEEVSVGQLIEIAKFAADRSGFGPQSKQEVNVNVGMAEAIDRARQRVLAAKKQPLMLDITPESE